MPKTKRGVSRGYTVSSKLFMPVLEYVFRRLEWDNKGINVHGEKLHNLRFADDTVLISDNLGEGNEMIQQFRMATQRVGLHINNPTRRN